MGVDNPVLIGAVIMVLMGGLLAMLWYSQQRHQTAPDLGYQRRQAVPQAQQRRETAAAMDVPQQTRPLLRHEVEALLADVPHLVLFGPTKAGKTTWAQALLAGRSGHVLIIDPDYEPGAWGGLPVVTTGDGDDFSPIEATLKGLLGEMKRRVDLRKAGTLAAERDLTIVWDEVPDCVEECPSAGLILRRLARRSAKYKMRLIILSQSERVSAFGLEKHGDALKNFVWLRCLRRETTRGVVREAAIYRHGDTPRPVDPQWVRDASQHQIPTPRFWRQPESESEISFPADELSTALESEKGKFSKESFVVSTADITRMVLAQQEGKKKTETLTSLSGYSGSRHGAYSEAWEQIKRQLEG